MRMPLFVLTAAPAALLVLTAAGGATADDFDSPSGTGTAVTWQGNGGQGSITFFDNGSTFQGTAQFPGEGPVGYRGNS
ncbi:hypothetical protein ACPXCP_41060 [Streptomyces sp. DT20]|uniref:hypothetical protein n=1 Tax=unclassified Streptomyces TaxID=2593676 RepID=UPI002E2CFBC9|nr:hypothetical protein [Streptomyces sp. NBC_00304]